MIANPKPAPRAPKARHPIARKRTKPRTVKTSCMTRACKRAPTAGTLCLTHAKRKADELWGKAIRKDHCELADIGPCGGVIQACHLFSRGYMGTRYLLENGLSGCAGHNFYAEIKPLEWDEYIRRRLGEKEYGRLRDLALNFGRNGGHTDYTAIIADLSGRVRNEEANGSGI